MSTTDAEAHPPASPSRPPGSVRGGASPIERRLWALCSLACLLASVALAVAIAIDRFPRGITVLACLLVFVWAARKALIMSGRAQALAAVLAVAALAGVVVLLVLDGRALARVIVVVLFALSVLAGRRAFRVHVRLPAGAAAAAPRAVLQPEVGRWQGRALRARQGGEGPRHRGRPADAGERPRRARPRGRARRRRWPRDGRRGRLPGDRRGDRGGAQPAVCLHPGGHRNHFALDLGVDRNDVVGALDAFRDGGERRVDLAEVNGRVFVNNVSLGVYAEAVQRDEYRDAKLRTLAATAAAGEGAGSELQWDRGRGSETAALVLVSNNPYRLARGLAGGTRPRLDGGVLGVAVLGGAHEAGEDAGSVETKPSSSWSESTFEVQAPGPVPAGIDGEAAMLDPPLRFRSRPGVLRVRIAPAHPGASPSAILPESPFALVAALGRFAFGPAQPEPVTGAQALSPGSPEPSGERPQP